MVTAFYFVVFVLSVVMMGNFLLKNKRVDTLFILFSLFVMLNSFGRYMVASSKTYEVAILSNQILYVGACFAPFFTLLTLARLCNVSVPKPLKFILSLYSTVVMGFVMTIGKSELYYKNVELVRENGYSYLKKTYGPFHSMYPILMIVYAILMIVFLIYAFRCKKRLSFRLIMIICVTCFSVITLYIVERIADLKISFVPVGYLIGIAFMISYFERLNMFDISSNIAVSIDKMKEYGYIIFDNKFRYVTSNDYMKEVFPQMSEWVVDSPVPQSDTDLYHDIVEYLLDYSEDNNTDRMIQVGERYYERIVRDIQYGSKKKVGYLVEIIDRTMEKKYYNAIEDYNASLEKEVKEKTENIMHIKDMMVLGMADMVESRDNSTGGHIKRTSAVVHIFSKRLKEYCEKFGFDEFFLQRVEKAAPMHDLGKIAIRDEVLRKPGKYTDEEYNEMKRHSEEGARIVVNILQGLEDDSFVSIAENIARCHHEKWNGKGYPSGLSGENIPIEARIMALADVFDALVSKRCYKDAFSYDKAFAIIEESLGEHFDPLIGRVFIDCRTELEAFYNSYE